ncbi:hypothetical protein ACMFMF_004162 [Clarireedia jacksonii]
MSQQVNGNFQSMHHYGPTDTNSHHTKNLTSQQYYMSAQAAGDAQNEMITRLRVRIAVLEADLNHAAKEKDDAIKSSVIIARALGGIVNDSSRGTNHVDAVEAAELGELRLEVKRLRRENGVLWERIESRESGILTGANNATKLPEASYTSNREMKLSKERTSQVDPVITAAQKKVSVWDSPDASSSNTTLPVSHHESIHHPYIVDFDPHKGIPFPPLTPSVYPPSTLSNKDIGMTSLESLLGDSTPSSPITPQISDQIQTQERALAELTPTPPPRVLRTGFASAPTTVRGADYATWDHPEREAYYTRHRNHTRFEAPPNLSQGSAIWSSPQERFEEIQEQWSMTQGQGRGDPRMPEYFKYGIRFVPAASESENVFRTVRIGNLPRDVELREVVARVRGGRLYSVALLDTVKLEGSMTALVVFVEQADAEAYVDYAGGNGVMFSCGVDKEVEDGKVDEGVKASVTLIPTPTFPLSEFQRRNIFQENRTRMLSVRHFPKTASLRRLESDIAKTGRLGSLCEWYMDGDDTLWLEFAGIESAGVVFGLLRGRYEYRDLEVRFERDACEGKIEELRQPIKRKRPMFPRQELKEGRLRNESEGLEVEVEVEVVGSTLMVQRRRLAASRDQQVGIPRCVGDGLKGSSWADEANDDAVKMVDEDDERGRYNFHSERLEKPLEFRSRSADRESRPEASESTDSSTSTSTSPSPLESTSDVELGDGPTPTGPTRKIRILTAKEYLLEHPNSQTSTPSRGKLQPQALTLAIPTSSNPPYTNPDPSSPSPLSAESAEYSLHSYASEEESVGSGKGIQGKEAEDVEKEKMNPDEIALD